MNTTAGPEMQDAGETTRILRQAQARALEARVEYFGMATPAETWAVVSQGRGRIIDVRTRAEWEWVGRIPGSTLIEWKIWPAMESNPEFLDDLRRVADPAEAVFFLCRSGVRSHAAAIAAHGAGFSCALNILEGFEGDIDENKHRGGRGGWRYAGLPWEQG